MTEAGLAERLNVPRAEALTIKTNYFSKLSSLKKNMDRYITYALYKGHIIGPGPYNRIRFFPEWEQVKSGAYAFLKGISDNQVLAAIAREACNMPIQGGGADVMKTALCLILAYIRENKLLGTVKIVLNVHDEIVCEYPDDMIEWPEIQNKLMKKAADLVVPSGLLHAEYKNAKEWIK